MVTTPPFAPVFGRGPRGPLVVGHRGVRTAGIRENTVEAAWVAIRAGAAWVEVDVRLGADETLVLHHDPVLADGRPVEDCRRSQFVAAGVQTLEQLLGDLPTEIGVDLEVKATRADVRRPAAATTAGRTVALAGALTPARPLLVTSFYPPALVAARAVAPHLPVGLLTTSTVRLGVALRGAVRLRAQVAAIHVASLLRGSRGRAGRRRPLERTVAGVRERGLEVLAWGVDPAHVELLRSAGVAAVCVDDVAGTVRALRPTA